MDRPGRRDTVPGDLAERLARAESRLAELEDLYQDLFDNTPALIVRLDEKGIIREANGTVRALLGHPPEAVTDRPFVDLIEPDTRKVMQPVLASALEGKPLRVSELLLLRSDGNIVPVEVEASVPRTGAGGLRLALRDITRRKEQEQRQNALQHRLSHQAKMNALGQIVARVAHELNQHLTVIGGYGRLLVSEGVGGETQRERLNRIRHATESCSRVVRNLQAFSTESSGEPGPLDPQRVLDAILNVMDYPCRVADITIKREGPRLLPSVKAEHTRLQQALYEILDNAYEELRALGRPGCITVTTRIVGDQVRLEVSDDGRGIPPDQLREIFEPFFTTRAGPDHAGLGLSIAETIIEEFGGTLEVRSHPGRGTTMVVSLPTEGLPKEPAPAAPTPRSVQEGTPLLVVDDDEGLLFLSRDYLGRYGYKVDTASDGQQAAEKVALRTYAAIVCDLKMPRMTGQEFYEHLQKEHPELTPHVIFITGDIFTRPLQRFLKETRNPYLRKPFDMEVLAKLIRTHMRPLR